MSDEYPQLGGTIAELHESLKGEKPVGIMEPKSHYEWTWARWGNLHEPLFLPVENLIKQGYNPFK